MCLTAFAVWKYKFIPYVFLNNAINLCGTQLKTNLFFLNLEFWLMQSEVAGTFENNGTGSAITSTVAVCVYHSMT